MSPTYTNYFETLQQAPSRESSPSSDRFKLLMLVSLSIALFPLALIASVVWTATDSTRRF